LDLEKVLVKSSSHPRQVDRLIQRPCPGPQ
jgi:hypothetical protein